MSADPTSRYDLTFLAERACDPTRPFAPDERAALALVHTALMEADALVIRLGGRAGRLGETIAATGLLEGILAALQSIRHASIPIHLIVDNGAASLFDARLYQARGWTGLHISAVPTSAPLDLGALALSAPHNASPAQHTLVLDLHGAHDDTPALEIVAERDQTVTIFAHLARTGLRDYAVRSPARRYADFIEDLFSLTAGSIPSEVAQPRILLSDADDVRFPALANTLDLDPTALLVVCFFQSVVVAKCYERWDDVLARLCERVAAALPGRRIDFLLACGPDDQQPPGFVRADLADWLGGFTGTNGNARVLLATIPNLRDLAIVLSRAALALSNDTGPGHLAGALGVSTITPYLPGDLYSRQVWASTLHHHGVTLDPNPYTRQQLEAAVTWDHTDIINSIPPGDLVIPAFACMMQAARRHLLP